MTRSVRHRPHAALCGGSQKRDKQYCARATRRHNRVLLASVDEDAVFARPEEMLDEWSMSQDGTRRYSPYDGSVPYQQWFRWVKSK